LARTWYRAVPEITLILLRHRPSEDPPGTNPEPLTWRLVGEDPIAAKRNAFVLCTCPKGHDCYLSADVHAVAIDGSVMPSYVCPVPDCGFHEHVRLENWSP
jgi:hypothetical protein